MALKLHISRTPDGHGFSLPMYESPNHMGLRLQAAISGSLKLEAGERVYIPIGFAIGIPKGVCGQIVSSTIAAKEKGIVVIAPQILNPADRMPLYILVQNVSRRPQIIKRGEFIAELLITQAYQICWNEIEANAEILNASQAEVLTEASAEEADEKSASKRRVKSIRSRVK